LPRRLGDARSDGGLHPARRARVRLPSAVGHGDGVQRRAQDSPLRRLDRAVSPTSRTSSSTFSSSRTTSM
jgi:hypothetical protein